MFLLAFSFAHAFCGTYVGDASSTISNGASKIGVSREGRRTTLTLFNDFKGDTTDFATLIPVPEILGPEDVKVVDPGIIARWDAFSAPREVSYSCSDFATEQQLASPHIGCGYADYALAAGMEDMSLDSGATVGVEAQFTVGAYDIVILSADESGGLLQWLNSNGYAIPGQSADLLQDYIDGGSYFFAARVHLDGLENGQAWLPPLQFGYDSDVFSLPIRLGTLNGQATQDLLLYILTPGETGGVGIANYPEVKVEDECMYQPEAGDGMADYYLKELDSALAASDRPGWITEFSTEGMGCDPCGDIELGDSDALDLGFTQSIWSSHLTRLHLRYNPQAVDQDLVFYTSAGTGDLDQIRYIQYNPQLEDHFPVCKQGWVEDPGTCADASAEADAGGCSVSPTRDLPGLSLLGLVSLAAWYRRRHL